MTDGHRPEETVNTPLDRNWIDVSVPVRAGMVHWPDDPEVEIIRIADMAEGYPMNLSMLSMSAHTGTHVDAPLHMVSEGAAIDQAPLALLVGRARVIEIVSEKIIEPGELRDKGIEPGSRILFKTANSPRCWKASGFVEDYVGLSPAAADYLAERKVALVGIDYLSIGPYGPENEQTHQVLLHAGVWVIEGLDLSAVEAGEYEMVCLPINLVRAEGSPARVIVRRMHP